MKKAILFLSSLAIISFSYSQIDVGGKLRDKIRNRADQKVDETIDKGLDKTEEEVKKSHDKEKQKEKAQNNNNSVNNVQNFTPIDQSNLLVLSDVDNTWSISGISVSARNCRSLGNSVFATSIICTQRCRSFCVGVTSFDYRLDETSRDGLVFCGPLSQ